MLGSSLTFNFPTIFPQQKVRRLAADGAGHSSAITLDKIYSFLALEASQHAAGDEGQIIQTAVLAGGQRMHALLRRGFAREDAGEVTAARFLFFPVVLLGWRGSNLAAVSKWLHKKKENVRAVPL